MSSMKAIYAFADTIKDRAKGVDNEEATKHALICPFLSVLGYDVGDAKILSPEYRVVVSTGRTKKIDYVLHACRKSAIVIECKPCTQSLGETHVEQLGEYFGASEARFGLLTNGIEYQFYTEDSEQEGTMDSTPFLTVDLLDDMKAGFHDVCRLFSQKGFDEEKALRLVPHVRDCAVTDAERNGVRLIRALLHGHVESMRITPINTRRYCNIVLDHTTRKRICLLWFTKQGKPMRLSVFATGKEKKVPIQSLDDLHRHKKAFVAMIDRHEGPR